MKESFYQIPGLPCRLALLSDLHNRPFDAVMSSLRVHHPSIICVTGDFVYGEYPDSDNLIIEEQENVLPFFKACVSVAPTYVSLGNHEHLLCPEDLRLIRSTGAVVLDNSFARIDGKKIVIAGLSSGYFTRIQQLRITDLSRYPKQDGHFSHAPDTSWLENFASTSGYHILLSHHPEYYPLIPREINLMLSGHAHGGQWRIFNHGIFAPDQGLWPKYSKGIYDGRLVVSAGLSNTAGIPRFFNPTEVVYIDPLS